MWGLYEKRVKRGVETAVTVNVHVGWRKRYDVTRQTIATTASTRIF